MPGNATATGTITDDDLAVVKTWLSRLGRTVASQVVEAVDNRLFSGYGNEQGLLIGAGSPSAAGWDEVVSASSFRYSTVDDGPTGA